MTPGDADTAVRAAASQRRERDPRAFHRQVDKSPLNVLAAVTSMAVGVSFLATSGDVDTRTIKAARLYQSFKWNVVLQMLCLLAVILLIKSSSAAGGFLNMTTYYQR